eukprot:1242621-Rhodomonas_salina.2
MRRAAAAPHRLPSTLESPQRELRVWQWPPGRPESPQPETPDSALGQRQSPRPPATELAFKFSVAPGPSQPTPGPGSVLRPSPGPSDGAERPQPGRLPVSFGPAGGSPTESPTACTGGVLPVT